MAPRPPRLGRAVAEVCERERVRACDGAGASVGIPAGIQAVSLLRPLPLLLFPESEQGRKGLEGRGEYPCTYSCCSCLY